MKLKIGFIGATLVASLFVLRSLKNDSSAFQLKRNQQDAVIANSKKVLSQIKTEVGSSRSSLSEEAILDKQVAELIFIKGKIIGSDGDNDKIVELLNQGKLWPKLTTNLHRLPTLIDLEDDRKLRERLHMIDALGFILSLSESEREWSNKSAKFMADYILNFKVPIEVSTEVKQNIAGDKVEMLGLLREWRPEMAKWVLTKARGPKFKYLRESKGIYLGALSIKGEKS